MHRQLRPVVSVEDLVQNSHFPPFMQTGIRLLTNILQEYLGRPLLLPHYDQLEMHSARMLQALVSLGIVTHLEHEQPQPDEPFQHLIHALPHGFGHSFFSEKQAIQSALCEAVERFAWERSDEYYKQDQKRCTYAQLKGRRAVDIFSLAGFSEEQKLKHERLQFTEKTTFSWLPARSLVDNKPIWCPTSLISIKYALASDEPMLRWNITTGLAAHTNMRAALTHALCEIIERDAFMISYLNTLTPPKIDLDSLSMKNPFIKEILTRCERNRLKVTLLLLPTDFPVDVVLAVIQDQTNSGPALTVSARAGFSIEENIAHAMSEALTIRIFLRSLPSKSTAHSSIDRTGRLQYWGDSAHAKELEFFLSNNPSVHLDALSQKKMPKDPLLTLTEAFKDKGLEACYVETTPKAVRKYGIRSVAVVAPQMQPLHLDESIPHLGGRRLHEVPKTLGYTPRQRLNPIPHPYP